MEHSLKVGNRFINMARYEVAYEDEADSGKPVLHIGFNDGAAAFVGHERDDLLAWLNENSIDVTGMSQAPAAPALVQLSGEANEAITEARWQAVFEANQLLGEKDTELVKLRRELNTANRLLHNVDQCAPMYLEALSANGFSELAGVIEEVRATLPTPF